MNPSPPLSRRPYCASCTPPYNYHDLENVSRPGKTLENLYLQSRPRRASSPARRCCSSCVLLIRRFPCLPLCFGALKRSRALPVLAWQRNTTHPYPPSPTLHFL